MARYYLGIGYMVNLILDFEPLYMNGTASSGGSPPTQQ